MCFMIFLMPLYFFPSHVNDVVFFFLADDLQRHNLEVQKEAKDLRGRLACGICKCTVSTNGQI